jgi:hypothetical protein
MQHPVGACKNSGISIKIKTPLRKLRTFLSLSPERRWLTAEALLLPPLISASFHLFGVPRTQAWLRHWSRVGAAAEPADALGTIQQARRAQRLVKRSTGVGGSCLVRSFSLWTLLLRRGLPTEIRVGLRRHEGQIEGHAWIEYRGVPLNEDAKILQTYQVYERPISFDVKCWR